MINEEDKYTDLLCKLSYVFTKYDDFVFSIDIQSDWKSIHVMQSKGHGFARIYFFDDIIDCCYLDMMGVECHYRKNGLGTILQEIREEIGKVLEYKYSYLWVEKDSWMRDWYKRRGYVDSDDYGENHIWMKKELM